MNYLALLFFLLFVGYAWLFVLVIVTHRKLKEAEARLHDMYVRTFHIEQLTEDIQVLCGEEWKIGDWKSNPIDACVEMILKLNEQKLL